MHKMKYYLLHLWVPKSILKLKETGGMATTTTSLFRLSMNGTQSMTSRTNAMNNKFKKNY